MSLPSYAIYYDKDDNEIHREFVNVGWFLSEDTWVNRAFDLPKIYNAVSIKLYGITFQQKCIGVRRYKPILNTVYQQHQKEYNKQQPNPISENESKQERIKQIVSSDTNRIMIPVIRRIIPEMIAAEIVGVQPMQDYVSQVFELKLKYSILSKYKIIRYIQNKYSNLQHYYKKQLIYITSIFKWYNK